MNKEKVKKILSILKSKKILKIAKIVLIVFVVLTAFYFWGEKAFYFFTRPMLLYIYFAFITFLIITPAKRRNAGRLSFLKIYGTPITCPHLEQFRLDIFLKENFCKFTKFCGEKNLSIYNLFNCPGPSF